MYVYILNRVIKNYQKMAHVVMLKSSKSISIFNQRHGSFFILIGISVPCDLFIRKACHFSFTFEFTIQYTRKIKNVDQSINI